MDAKQFLAEFGHIANAPSGVVQLRELILQLAIQGKLISSGVASESSQTSLAGLKAIKAQLVAEKKLPREKPYPEISVVELPTDRPLQWEWARFGEVWQLLSGRDLENNQYNGSKNGIPYITGASNIENGVINVNRWTDQPVVISVINDLLITCKGTIGKTAFNDIGEMHIARQIMAIRNFSEKMDTGFLKIWLDSFVSQLVEKSKSMIPGFSREDLIYAIYPLPPLVEQSRIVAKVDELMALCDKLETQQKQRRSLQNNLRLSILQAVAASTSPYELQTAWTRLADNFGRLFQGPEDVTELRNLVLDLAVSGLLSMPSASDTPASHTFEEIKRIERLLVEQNKLSRPKSFPPLRDEKELFNLPNGWIWVRLGELAPDFQNGISKRHSQSGIDTVVLRLADIIDNKILVKNPRYIRLTDDERQRYLLREGDILITRVNGSADLVGSFIQVKTDGVAYCDHFIRLCLLRELIDVGYIWVASRSPIIRQQIAGKFVTTAGQKTVNQNHIGSILMPLPPLEEQRRLVKRVSDLMRLCDSLESQLRHANKLTGLLTKASIANLTDIATESEEDEPLKAPKTELVTSLRLGTPPNTKSAIVATPKIEREPSK